MKDIQTGTGAGADSTNPTQVYKPDSIGLMIPGLEPEPELIPYGTDVRGKYFDGYPQLVKVPPSEPRYRMRKEKDVMVTMRDGARLAVDIYRPDTEGERFPAIMAYGMWGKDAQEAIEWNADKPQRYYDSPLWDGTMEAGDFTYTVPRGYVHVIPDPRGVGNSDGGATRPDTVHNTDDIHDLVEWIAAQPWCTGKVGMMGPSSYSWSQGEIAQNGPPPHLTALRPDEMIYFAGDQFHGIFDTLGYHIVYGRHGNDSTPPPPNRPVPQHPSLVMQHLPKAVFEARLAEALENPDYKYNTKWYSALRYPMKSSWVFDTLLDALHPMPMESRAQKIELPMYVGTPWAARLYIWGAFHVYEKAGTPDGSKKLIVYPPGFPPRPHTSYHDETVRWYDYQLKGIDNGIVDEPPIKMFVMGVNKWKFENEWPLKRTQWTKFHLHPGGRLSPDAVGPTVEVDRFTQPAAYLDAKVYCLKYQSEPMEEEMEITGPVACHLDASIDIDDTNWMVDLIDVAPDGTRQLLSTGYLKAKFRALDEAKSKPWQPIHPRQEPVAIVPGEMNTYSIQMMPTANVFRKGHRVELVVRNQDDLLSRLGTWGVYMLPFMRTVTHTIHFGSSHVLLPLVPRAQG